MVIVIHQTANTQNAFDYNEKKVAEGVATYFDSANTLMTNPFLFDQNHRLKILHDIEKLAPRAKNKCLHISVNPSKSDGLILGDQTIRLEIRQMMEHTGYGNQPYFVYKHKDLDRVHFHVVSTRIDSVTGKKINTHDVYQFNADDRQVFKQVMQELKNCFSVLQKYADTIDQSWLGRV